jgi:hypothetical protein
MINMPNIEISERNLRMLEAIQKRQFVFGDSQTGTYDDVIKLLIDIADSEGYVFWEWVDKMYAGDAGLSIDQCLARRVCPYCGESLTMFGGDSYALICFYDKHGWVFNGNAGESGVSTERQQ